jgi:hypothetical protein
MHMGTLRIQNNCDQAERRMELRPRENIWSPLERSQQYKYGTL